MEEKQINHSERSHALLSASSAHRWLSCPPSAVASEAYPDQDTEFTREGTLAHEVAEIIARQMLTGGGEYSDKEPGVTGEMVDCANRYADYIQEQLKSPDAVVLLEQKVDFSPWVPDGFGTCDCIIIQGDTLIIIDYKYGQGVAVSAVDNPQMKLYALGALNDYGFACDVTKVEMHIFQPRLDSISDDSLTADELLDWAEKTVKPTAVKAFKGKGNYSAGEHCRFCQHAGRCRKLKAVCTEYVETHDLRVGVPVLADFEIAEALKMEPLITLWLRKVKEQGGLLVHNHPAYRRKTTDKSEWQEGIYAEKWFDGVEIVNGSTFYPKMVRRCIEENLFMVAATDAHRPTIAKYRRLGIFRTHTLIFAKENTQEAIKEALLERRTVGYCGDNLMGKEELLKDLFNASVECKLVSNPNKGKERIFIVTNNSSYTYTIKRGRSSITLEPFKSIRVALGKDKEGNWIEPKYYVMNMWHMDEMHPQITLQYTTPEEK